MTKVRVLGFTVAVLLLGAAPSACSTSQSLVAAGQPCLNATDCQPGLVCIPTGNGSDRVCSDDLSGVQKTETTDSGAKAREAGTAEGGTKEGGSTDSGGATQDTFQPPVDSGSGG